MFENAQEQVAVGGATAIQAGGNVSLTKVGLTYLEVRDVALDVFRANFYELAGMAKEVAKERAEQITEKFLKQLEKENPGGLGKANDPDFQHSLFTVQKEYARCGDKDLGDLLVDLLVDRSKQDQRNILQIVLNESLLTAPKLTESQLAALAIVFFFRYTQSFGIGNHQALGKNWDRNVLPFAGRFAISDASYQHLDFCNCGSSSLAGVSLEQILGSVYQGLFSRGFDASEIANRQISVGLDSRYFIPCLNDASKVQVRANNIEGLTKRLAELGTSKGDRGKIIDLFNFGKMNDEEIREKTVAIRGYMAEVFDVWSSSPMQSFNLTSVGIAIGHANIKRLVGEFADLSIWIN